MPGACTDDLASCVPPCLSAAATSNALAAVPAATASPSLLTPSAPPSHVLLDWGQVYNHADTTNDPTNIFGTNQNSNV